MTYGVHGVRILSLSNFRMDGLTFPSERRFAYEEANDSDDRHLHRIVVKY